MFSTKHKFRSNKLHQKKKKIFVFRLVMIGIFIIAIFWGIGYSTRQDFMKVDNVRIEGVYYADADSVKKIVLDNMEGAHLFLIPRSSSIGVPEKKILNDIKNTFQAIDTVKVDVKGLKEVKVEIKEYEPVATWCRAESEIDKCYFVNRESKIFLPEPLIHTFDLIKFKGAIEGDPMGQFYTDEKTFNGYLELVKLFRRSEIEVSEIITEDKETFIAITDKGVRIFFDNKDNVNEIYENLVTTIERDAINKAQFGNIDYIDLRFENRVYYKLK